MSEIKHTMPVNLYSYRKTVDDKDFYPTTYFQSSYLAQTSYTRTDIVQELVEALERILSLVSINEKHPIIGDTINQAQQALNKAKGLGE